MSLGEISLFGLVMLIVGSIVQFLVINYSAKGYLPEKGKLKALAEEYPDMKIKLSETTDIVEGIRDEIAKRTWASQQVWNIKKDAYDKIWINLLEMKEYASERLTIDGQYFDIFLDNCGHGEVNEDGHSEEELNNYYEYAEKDISHQKEIFNRKYNTTQYISEQNDKKLQYINNLKNSIKNIEINSIYLSPNITATSLFLTKLVNNQFKDNSYSWEVSENEGISEYEWYEHIISEYEKLLEALKLEMNKVKDLAMEELHLEAPSEKLD